ncbi:hypothetical protein HanRHA438_Chr03g0119391 [Helianthus annuus]|nr:hypothetical protein HanRHA438_Chr03g0119391 [Helianthus annuus]
MNIMMNNIKHFIMVVKVPTRLRVLPEYSLQGRLPRHEYSSPRPITPRVLPNTPEYLPSTPESDLGAPSDFCNHAFYDYLCLTSLAIISALMMVLDTFQVASFVVSNILMYEKGQ